MIRFLLCLALITFCLPVIVPVGQFLIVLLMLLFSGGGN